MFRDAECRLDMAFNEAIITLSNNSILWLDQSKRKHGHGSSYQQLEWHRILTRFWNDSIGSACIILELRAYEPYDTSWGVPFHWSIKILTEPRKLSEQILSDFTAKKQGNSKLEEVILVGLNQFILQRIEWAALRVGRNL